MSDVSKDCHESKVVAYKRFRVDSITVAENYAQFDSWNIDKFQVR